MKNLFLGFLLLFMLSCKQDKTVELNEFPVKQELKGFKVDKDYFLQTSKVFTLNDSVALFLSIYNKENIFNLVNLESYDLLNSFGIIGHGPGEFTNPAKIYIEPKKEAFWISDGMQQKIFRYPIDSILNRQDFIPYEIIDTRKYGVVAAYIIDNKKLSLYSGETKEFILYSCKEGMKKGIGKSHLFFPGDRILNLTKRLKTFKRHPSRELYAVSYIREDLLLIMNKKGEILHRVKGPGFIDPLEERGDYEFPVTTYTKLCVDENYIYALYNGKKGTSMNDRGEFVLNDPERIFIFTWEGKPVKELKLEYPAFSFDLDKQRNRIITYSNALDEEIVYYNYEF